MDLSTVNPRQSHIATIAKMKSPSIDINMFEKISQPQNQGFFLIKPKKTIFYLVFFLTFCFSGIISMMNFIPYRMGLMSLLVLPLVFLYGLKTDRVAISYFFLAIIILLSTIYNRVSLLDFALFMRTLLFSYLIYYLVKIFVKKDNISKIIRLCITIGMLQLPVVIFQIFTYDLLPTGIREGLHISEVDYSFGTFNLKGDAPMAFFLLALVIFLLFDSKRNYFIRKKWFVVFWFSLTIFIANAQMIKLALLLVWGVYFFVNFRRNAIIVATIILLFITCLMVLSTKIERTQITVGETLLAANRSFSTGQIDRFLSGSYSRGGAIYYYLNTDILWLGDGPSQYFDVINKDFTRGNTGHIFTFYSEVGILGWLASVAIFFIIAFPVRGWRLKFHMVSLLLFASIQLLSFTTHVMNDISIFLIYNIVSKHMLIPIKERNE